MKEIHKDIWDLALPYLEKGLRKDLVTHSKYVFKCMEILLKNEGGNKNILIPAAILHDVGWSKVPPEIQINWRNSEDKIKGERLHLEYAQQIIREILGKTGYHEDETNRIIDIVVAHKFQDPNELDKQLLIDADSVADAFKKQFYSDAKAYDSTPEELYNFRKKNKFYTKTARRIFEKELEMRKKEFEN
ncbi:HD domain-containing protein [Candidatus Pacearchaeota archaeon]|nr:HD domain-containing protein [Candidatus Pacearchaeota archaeon]